jgi:His/Glu/Gln/Arg/opine family amino acid ABC transporter permease subunit
MNFNIAFCLEVLKKLVSAVPLTLYLTLWSFGIGMVIAIVIALVRYHKIPVFDKIFQFYVSFIRGTPVMLQLYIIYYMIPMAVDAVLAKTNVAFRTNQIEIKVLVVVALSINVSAYLSEILRSGLISLGRGEIEAAYSIGMTSGMTIRRIIIPQVLVICIPNFSANLISVLQASSLAYFVSLQEVTGTAKIMASSNWKYFEAFVATGIVYWVLTVIIELLTYVIEKIVEKNGYSLKIH